MITLLKKIFLLIFILIIAGCESEEIISPEIDFEEYTVVQAEIQPGKYFPAVRITKTLPLGVPYDIKKAELKTVTAYLVKNEVQVIPLLYTFDGLYEPRYEFYVEEGEVYEIYATSDDKFIYGKTIVPHRPIVTSVNYNGSDYYLGASIQPETDVVYGALWIVTGNPPVRAEDYFSITQSYPNPYNPVGVRTSSIPEEYTQTTYAGQRYIQVYAFDQTFREYFYSRTSGQEINDPYVQGGGVVEWNMQGDKVIGMFIGVTPGDIINVN